MKFVNNFLPNNLHNIDYIKLAQKKLFCADKYIIFTKWI